MRPVAMEQWHGQDLMMSLWVPIFLVLLAHVLPPSTRRAHIMSKGSFDVTVWIPVGKWLNKAVMTASDNAAHLALFLSLLFELPFNGSAVLSIAATLMQPACHVIRHSLATDHQLNHKDLFYVCLPTL